MYQVLSCTPLLNWPVIKRPGVRTASGLTVVLHTKNWKTDKQLWELTSLCCDDAELKTPMMKYLLDEMYRDEIDLNPGRWAADGLPVGVQLCWLIFCDLFIHAYFSCWKGKSTISFSKVFTKTKPYCYQPNVPLSSKPPHWSSVNRRTNQNPPFRKKGCPKQTIYSYVIKATNEINPRLNCVCNDVH